jgi:hypothetical protein
MAQSINPNRPLDDLKKHGSTEKLKRKLSKRDVRKIVRRADRQKPPVLSSEY